MMIISLLLNAKPKGTGKEAAIYRFSHLLLRPDLSFPGCSIGERKIARSGGRSC
ncbi:hypothetical protein AXF42_Ash012297 [Apostasia shenzhenica]|uniref:Uncharacterized protein n=1 Tax=Apostasia shenzhenica TaxID=1088818 RepID=A0A2I0B4K1_9ASPA|nr:hypothetical protein AXF42_Ash012297 [Apostasia shenzhenica]